MKITINGWESSGLRCPDVKVNLLINSTPSRVALIQMPNGTGKTTTLKLIRASLTGAAQNWSRDEISELKSLKNPNVKTGKFILELSVDEKQLVIETIIDFVESKVRYRTTSILLGGVEDGWRPPPNIKRFLEEKFVSLFIFDGEFAADLLNSTKTKATEAIETLSQLDLLDEVISETDFFWEKQKRDASGTSKPYLNSLKDKEGALIKRLAELNKSRDTAQIEVVAFRNRLAEVDAQLEEKIGQNETIRNEKDRLSKAKSEAESELSTTLEKYMQDLRYPHKLFDGFVRHLNTFKVSLDQAKLPDTSSRQFFIDLCEEDSCVCGRPIGPDEQKHIREHAEHYLSGDISGVLNAIKNDINIYANQSSDEPLSDSRIKLSDSQAKFHNASTSFSNYMLKIKDLQDKGYEELLNEKAQIENNIRSRDSFLSIMSVPYKSSDDEKSSSVISIETQLRGMQVRIAEVTDTVELRNRVNLLTKIAINAKLIAKKALHEQLIIECNERLSKVLVNSPLQIEDIDNHIKLKGQAGGSVGQTLAVAYVFLTAALHRGSHQFPLVVDSPAGSLEQLVRKEVGKVIPELCEQFISFIIDTEKIGFVPALESASNNSISYSTIFRLNKTSENLIKNVPKENIQMNGDSVLVTGKEFFVQFTLDKEE
jgi:DNA sulfur modification protein DndD